MRMLSRTMGISLLGTLENDKTIRMAGLVKITGVIEETIEMV